MFIEKKENSNFIYLFYKIDNIIDRKTAITKFCQFCHNPNINFEHIQLDDNKSYHDGTNSVIIQSANDINACDMLDMETISLSAEYKNKPFAILMDFKTFLIRLSTPKDYMVDYRTLEQLLGLT